MGGGGGGRGKGYGGSGRLLTISAFRIGHLFEVGANLGLGAYLNNNITVF